MPHRKGDMLLEQLGFEQYQLPGHESAPVVADNVHGWQLQVLDQSQYIRQEVVCGITLLGLGFIGFPIAQHVRCDNPETGLDQRRGLVLPHARGIRHAMQQQHDLVAVTLVIDMVVNIVDQYFLAGEAHRFVSVLQR